MAKMWFYSTGGKQIGPVTGEVLKQLASAGAIGPEDHVRPEDQAGWFPARSVRGLVFANQPALPVPLTPRTTTVARTRNRRGPAIIGIAAGGLLIATLAVFWVNRGRLSTDSLESPAAPKSESVARAPETDRTDRRPGGDLSLVASLELVASRCFDSGDMDRCVANCKKGLDYIDKNRMTRPDALAIAARLKRLQGNASAKLAQSKASQDEKEHLQTELQRLRNIRGSVRGGAWLNNRDGTSNLLRGMPILALKAEVQAQGKAQLLSALLKDNTVQLAKDHDDCDKNHAALLEYMAQKAPGKMNWEAALKDNNAASLPTTALEDRITGLKEIVETVNKKVYDADDDDPMNFRFPTRLALMTPLLSAVDKDEFATSFVLRRRESIRALQEMIHVATQPSGHSVSEFSAVYDIYEKYSVHGGGAEHFWSKLQDSLIVAATTVDVEGKYTIRLPGGRFCLTAASSSTSAGAEWCVSVTIRDEIPVNIDFSKNNARSGFVASAK